MKEEWFPLVNEEGQTIGKATRRECHNGCKWLHPVVHLHIFNTFSPDPEEIEEGRFWSAEEIKAHLGKGVFTPNFESEYEKLGKQNLQME